MLALHQISRRHGHIVTQIVETELIVRTKRDICLICPASLLRVRPVLVDTIHRESMELIKRPHPLGVTLCQIIVHRYDMNTVTGQGIQEYRKRCHEGLTLTGSHLGNLTLMQHYAAKQLHIIMHHLPLQVVTTRSPMVMIYRLVSVECNKVFRRVCSQLAVEVGSRYHGLLILGETACGLLHYTECHGHNLVERLLINIENLLLQLVYLVEDLLTRIDWRIFNLRLQLCNLCLLSIRRVLHKLLDFLCFRAKLVVIKSLYFRINSLHTFHERLNQLHIAC